MSVINEKTGAHLVIYENIMNGRSGTRSEVRANTTDEQSTKTDERSITTDERVTPATRKLKEIEPNGDNYEPIISCGFASARKRSSICEQVGTGTIDDTPTLRDRNCKSVGCR